MNLKNKNVLILGLGISGVSTVKALDKLGAKISISDLKDVNDLKENLSQINHLDIDLFLGTNNVPLDNIDLIVKSPGIPLNLEIFKKAYEKGIEVITDLELAYRISPDSNIIAITGTNGKTTTTTLVGDFFKKAGFTTHVAGNIGVGILWDIVNSTKEDIFVIEASSFQLESTKEFNPKISLVLNITPDHLNWHNTLDNYINAKKKIFQNQGESGYTVLNYDDLSVRKMKDEINSNIIWFSVDSRLSNGIFVEGEYVVIKDGEKIERIVKTHEIALPGKHNLENALASIAIGWIMGVDIRTMESVLKTFPGVEHRIEYVDILDGVRFYNDSKGTNSDASIKAIEAINNPIVLIAGGMDKGTDFDDFILSFSGKVKALVLLGETKDKIKDTAIKYGFKDIFLVENMKEAVKTSFSLANEGDNVLLSPACASWDMYPSFEKRGDDFKESVFSLREENNG